MMTFYIYLKGYHIEKGSPKGRAHDSGTTFQEDSDWMFGSRARLRPPSLHLEQFNSGTNYPMR